MKLEMRDQMDENASKGCLKCSGTHELGLVVGLVWLTWKTSPLKLNIDLISTDIGDDWVFLLVSCLCAYG